MAQKQPRRSPLEDFTFAQYEPKYYEETLELLTKSYVDSSPLVTILGLTEEHMRKEFKKQLDTEYYRHGVLAIHKQSGEIAATLFWDVFEKFKWDNADLSKVPTKGDIRLAMRLASMYPYLQTIDTKAVQYLYSDNVVVNPKFMSAGLGNIIMYYFGLDLEYYGYRMLFGCAINKHAQAMYDKPWSKPIGVIDCKTITTLAGEKPFLNTDLTYKAYEIDGIAGVRWLEQKLGGKAVHPLRKSKL